MAMTTAPPTAPPIETLADLVHRLGDVPLERIRFHPYPGTAREENVTEVLDRENRPCELVDGVLVEKAMGFYQARMAAVLIRLIEGFLEQHDLGITLGADGTVRLAPGLVRIPDVAFFSWRHFPQRRLPRAPVPDLVPDLAVEVLSESNTAGEMARKLDEYLAAGVRLVWYVDPERRNAVVHTASGQVTEVGEDEALDGGEVLPGFSVVLRDWFTYAGERDPEE
jgi:Uma2 family endonuclease